LLAPRLLSLLHVASKACIDATALSRSTKPGAGALNRCARRISLSWLVLLGVPALTQQRAGENALALSFYLATLVALWPDPGAAGRRRSQLSGRRLREWVFDRAHRCSAQPGASRHALAFGLAVLAGWFSHPALLLLITGLGVTAGARAPTPSGVPVETLRVGFSLIVLAPLFEEWLYRGRLLPLCALRFGTIPAVLIASVAFALPHLRPWPVFGALIAGLILGLTRLHAGSVGPCMGLHAGWNAAACLADAGGSTLRLPHWGMGAIGLLFLLLSIRNARAARHALGQKP
jgi:membrane protease YdiL (CAAX protease family)